MRFQVIYFFTFYFFFFINEANKQTCFYFVKRLQCHSEYFEMTNKSTSVFHFISFLYFYDIRMGKL